MPTLKQPGFNTEICYCQRLREQSLVHATEFSEIEWVRVATAPSLGASWTMGLQFSLMAENNHYACPFCTLDIRLVIANKSVH